jgi:cyclic 2,3-diphosphoglycerate synthetase
MLFSRERGGGKVDTLYLVDGEHHPATTLDAVRELEGRENWRPIALYFLGGGEKLEDFSQLDLEEAELIVPHDPLSDLYPTLLRLKPQLVVDLSDLPVLGPAQRLHLAARALAAGAVYRGSDFEFRPPRFEQVLTKPSCAIIGTGKRCGKTAVSAEMARYLAREGQPPVIVAMGRGGPPQPQVLGEERITGDFLLSETEKGRHAASDHYEDALITGVITVGSRRCGGGLAGEPFVTNCVDAAVVADGLPGELVIMEGSGSSIPPVMTDAGICVISAAQDSEEALGYLGAYRLLISDGVIITMAEEPFASPSHIKELERRVNQVYGEISIVKTIFRPHPLKPIRGKRAFLVCTAPEAAGETLEGYLRKNEDCQVVGRSHNLSDRISLRKDLQKAEEAEILLTELKAAAVDVVAVFARERGKELVYFHNRTVGLGQEDDLERFFSHMRDLAVSKHAEQ